MHLIAAGFRDDVHDEARRLGLTESAGRGERDFLRVADVGHVRWRLAAAGRVAHIQAIHPHAALVGSSPMNGELRRHRTCGGIVDVGEDAWHHRHHRSVVALTGDGSDDVVINRRLAPGALHVDDGGGAGDGDSLLQPAHAHVGVHRRSEGPGQLDALTPERAETRECEGDAVGSRAQIFDAVLAGAVGDGGTDLFYECGTGRFDRHARQYRA